jgi:hypothetical protein
MYIKVTSPISANETATKSKIRGSQVSYVKLLRPNNFQIFYLIWNPNSWGAE